MRLYLSSFRLGDHPERLVDLIHRPGPVAVIANAMDASPDPVRREAVATEISDLASLGLRGEEVDLRLLSGGPAEVRERLAAFPALWVRGGNAFVLRAAMAVSGADVAVVSLLEADELVYAGYSAGPCVLSPSMRGLELVDHPAEVTRLWGREPVWDGLGVLDYAFVPHYASPGHPETDDIERVVAHYRERATPHQTLHDGEAIVVDGIRTLIV